MKNKFIKNIVAACLILSVGNRLNAQAIEPRREFKTTESKAMGLSSDGNWLVMSAKQQINVFHTRTGLVMRTFQEHNCNVTVVATSPRKRVAVSGDEHGHLILWNIDDLTVVQKYEPIKGTIKSAKFSKEGTQFVVVVGNKIRIYDLINPNPIAKLDKIGNGELSAVDLVESKNTLLTATENGFIATWTVSDSVKLVKTFKAHESKITGVSQLRNGMIVTASEDKTVKTWDVSGKMKKTFNVGEVKTMDVSADQKTVVLALNSGSTEVIDLATGNAKFKFDVKADVKESFYHPTEPLVISLYTDNTARSWILR
jgi:WD40 repeat protein